jgi:PAS domain S-box-containing protein
LALLPPKNPKDPIPVAGPEVLVVDANEEHQMLSALALSRRGFRVSAAGSAREGLRLALSKAFDAIVLDNKLRDMPSMEVLRALVDRLPKVPKIYVVAPGAEDVAVKALHMGATGYLVKTARYNEVLAVEVEDQIDKAGTKARLEEHQRALQVDQTERKRVEEALRESEERLRMLAARAPFVLWTTDPDLRFTSMLGSGPRLGLFPGQPLGRALEEVLGSPDPNVPFLDAHRRALEKEAVRFEQEWRGRTYDVHVEPLRKEGGPVLGVLGVALDVTDRVRSEKVRSAVYRVSQAATASENLQALFGSIHHIVSELMPASNFYVALHDAESETLSFPYFVDEEELPPPPQKVGKGLTEYVLRTGRALLASPEIFNALLKAGEVEQIGPPSIDWLGVPLVAMGRTIGVLVVQSYKEGVRYSEGDRELLKFVTNQIAMAIDRKRSEDALREKERAVSILLGNLPGMAYRCRNDTDWTDEFVSEGCFELLGVHPKDLVGAKRTTTFGALIHPEDRKRVWDEVQAALGERRPFRIRYRLRTVHGDTKWVWEQGRGVFDSNGRILALEGFIADVTDLPDLNGEAGTRAPAPTLST